MIELWRVVEANDNYEVSYSGKIRNKNTGKVLKPYPVKQGYLQVDLGIKHLAHRIVAHAFKPNPYNLPQVNHKDENNTNNLADNLEWCSRQYNVEYSQAQTYNLISPEGKEVEVFNMKKFCKKLGLATSAMYSVCNPMSKRKSHKGWRAR